MDGVVSMYEARLMQLPKKSLVHQLALSQSILESVLAPFLVVDRRRRILFLNRAAVAMMQGVQEPEYYLDQPLDSLLGPSEELDQILDACFISQRPVEDRDTPLRCLSGEMVTPRITVSPLFGMNNELAGCSLLLLDASRATGAGVPGAPGGQGACDMSPEALLQREAVQKTLVMMADETGALSSGDGGLQRFLDAVGLSLDEFLPPGHAEIVSQCLDAGQRKTGMLHKVGPRMYSWNYNPLLPIGMVQVNVSDVTVSLGPASAEAGGEESLHDPLTGLPNRALFMVLLSQALKRARRGRRPAPASQIGQIGQIGQGGQGGQGGLAESRDGRDSGRPFAVMFLDLDRFKLVNDSLGHDMGDQLLRGVSERILSVLRSCDTLARLSSDEFVILLDSVDDVAGALHAAERLQMALARPFQVQRHELFTTASIGLVVDNGEYESPEELIRDADTAMYRAKAGGKGGCVVFDKEMHKNAKRRLEIEMDLKKTLDKDEFRVFFQPIVDLRTLRLHGFEALARWFHPVRGMVSPADFIPLAEETGMIVHIGASVLYEACKTAADWRAAYPVHEKLMLSVNLSVRQFVSPTLLDDIQQILAWSEFPPNQLKLEITESGIMENAETSLALLRELRDMEIMLSIDDFGTGYSSLSYLHRFPFDYLKVDQSFVKLMHEGGENMKIVKTIISLAHDMEKQVIAEGIETLEQLATLRALGCEYGQGFFFAKPMPPDQTEAMLEQGVSWEGVLGPLSPAPLASRRLEG